MLDLIEGFVEGVCMVALTTHAHGDLRKLFAIDTAETRGLRRIWRFYTIHAYRIIVNFDDCRSLNNHQHPTPTEPTRFMPMSSGWFT